jgi:hypothetical protein
MRITIQLDDDIHLAAKELAALEGKTLGQIISALACTTLTSEQPIAIEATRDLDAGGSGEGESRQFIPI